MRITLINPPNVEFTGTFRPPINIAGLAAYVRQFGHTPNIIDFEAESTPVGNAITYRYTGTLPPGLD